METVLELLGGGLLGGIFGGLFRLAPEVLKFFNGRADRAHELAVMRLQIDADKARSDNRLQELRAEGDAHAEVAGLVAFAEAQKAQAKRSGIAWIDALSSLVRPSLTYWWMGLYTAVKVAVLMALIGDGTNWSSAIQIAWTPSDASVLAGIINFWFLDRVIRKREGY
jgi:hypothetical protein